jgi:hypothetical protein
MQLSTPPTAEIVEVKRLDHLPLVGAMLRELAVKDTLDALIPPHKRHAITVGECLEALVLTILTGEHALSRVAETLVDYDVEVIFHRPVDAPQFHDNRGHAGVPDPHYHIVLWYISPICRMWA